MTIIDVRTAKAHLHDLLSRVALGERLVITKHGQPVAQLVPIATPELPDVNQTILRMEAWQELDGPTLGPGLSIRGLREEGRR